MSVLLIAGSPTTPSRSAALLGAVEQHLRSSTRRTIAIDRLQVRDLPAEALLLADWGHASVRQALAQVERATALVVATPVYKAAYSGVLKVFLDLLPQTALKGKAVLPLATGGSPHHMLALDYALRPVLQSLGSRHILPGVYASDSQVPKDELGHYRVGAEIESRIEDAVQALINEGLRTPVSGDFPPISFSSLSYSV